MESIIKMSKKAYNILNVIAQIILPGIGTLYFALANIWQLPFGEEILGTTTAIDTFLGALIGISSTNYNTEKIDS